MKKILFLLVAAIFCLPIEANPPFNHYLPGTGAEGTNVAHEEFLTNRRKAKLTKYQNKTNKGYASYVNRIQQENFEEAKSCYADLFISIKELIINTSEISVIKDLIIEGASFKYLNPRDGLTTAEKQLILMFIGSK
jgi:hypothetical protein